MEIRIDHEFKELLPPLDKEEYALLEQSILSEGCRDPIILWHGMVVDGFNRYEICKKHNVPFKTYSKRFNGRKGVKVWIVKNQLGRRNLPDYERTRLALQIKPELAVEAKKHQQAGGGSGVSGRQKSDNPVDTKKEVAAFAGVSHDTVHKVEVVEKQGVPEVKEAARKGTISINRAYRETKKKTKGSLKPIQEERKLGPPSNGMQFARMAVMDLEQIREDDIERDKAFASVREWIEKATGVQASDAKERLVKCLGLLQEPFDNLAGDDLQVVREFARSISRKLLVLFPELTSPPTVEKAEQKGAEIPMERNGEGTFEVRTV